MVRKREIPGLLRQGGGNIVRVGSRYSNRFYKDVGEAAGRNYGEGREFGNRRGRWELYSREGFEIPWFDQPQDITFTDRWCYPTVNGKHEPSRDGFAALYFDHGNDSETEANAVVLGNHADIEVAKQDCRLFARRVLENPLYTSTVIRGVTRYPMATIMVAGIPVLPFPNHMKSYLGDEAMTALTLVWGAAALGAFVFERHSKTTPAGYLVDSLVSRRFPNGITEYHYGNSAGERIREEDRVIRTETAKADRFGRWLEVGLPNDKRAFLAFYGNMERGAGLLSDDRGFRGLAEARTTIAHLAGDPKVVDELFGKAVRVFSEPVKV